MWRIPLGCVLVLGLVPVLASGQPAASLNVKKTVGTGPTCASDNILDQVPPDGIVYYCYEMENTGMITSTAQSLVDDKLGSILSDFSFSTCCNNPASNLLGCTAAVCSDDSDCTNVSFPLCKTFTTQGVCCKSHIIDDPSDCLSNPSTLCITNSDCNSNATFGKCVGDDALIAPGATMTVVITASVAPPGVANTVAYEAKAAGICCFTSSCNPNFSCNEDSDCGTGNTCETPTGVCCEPGNPSSCAHDPAASAGEAPCTKDADCTSLFVPGIPPGTYADCIPTDLTVAEAGAKAQVGPVTVPAPLLSAVGLGLATLLLALVGLRHGAGFRRPS
jgi:hypothetical protein